MFFCWTLTFPVNFYLHILYRTSVNLNWKRFWHPVEFESPDCSQTSNTYVFLPHNFQLYICFVKFCDRLKFWFSDSLLVSQIIAGIVQQVYGVKHTSSYVLQCVQLHVMFSRYTHRFNKPSIELNLSLIWQHNATQKVRNRTNS